MKKKVENVCPKEMEEKVGNNKGIRAAQSKTDEDENPEWDSMRLSPFSWCFADFHESDIIYTPLLSSENANLKENFEVSNFCSNKISPVFHS